MGHTVLDTTNPNGAPPRHGDGPARRRGRDVRRRRLATVQAVFAAELAAELADALAAWSPPPRFAGRVVASSLEHPVVLDADVSRRVASGELARVELDVELLDWLRGWLRTGELPPPDVRAAVCAALRGHTP